MRKLLRDPNRIDEIINALRDCWKQNPDLRLGQLIYNLNKSGNRDNVFVPEDDKWLEWIKESIK